MARGIFTFLVLWGTLWFIGVSLRQVSARTLKEVLLTGFTALFFAVIAAVFLTAIVLLF